MSWLTRGLPPSALALLLLACGGGNGTDGGIDGDGASCIGATDGTACGEGRVCMDEVCVAGTRCGDGTVDDGEQCDDGNDTAFDGCEPGTCTFTCSDGSECDDDNSCNGTETCATSHVCELGTPPASGTPCTRPGMADGVCRGMGLTATCVDAGCGNGVPDGSEQCDDGNDVADDGCEPDCRFTCEVDADCDDGNVCTGVETCNTTDHRCETTGELDCDDENACTTDSCDGLTGCANVLIDADMDGHASTDHGECGDDCDDGDPMTYTGAPELCEASPAPPVDNDCDPSTPNPSASLWFLDCDEDSFSIVGAPSAMSCEMPAPSGGCGWTTRVPVSGAPATVDCNDANASMFPGQSMYFTSSHSSGSTDDARFGSYNCDGVAQYDRSRTNNASTSDLCEPGSFLGRITCSGSTGWVTTATVGCGFSGTYTGCSTPSRCGTDPRLCLRPGCDLVCTDISRTRCTATSGCTPGTRDCPWEYYCCSRMTDTSARMACH